MWSPGLGAAASVAPLTAVTPAGQPRKNLSMMQRLQMERRARLQAYKAERGIHGSLLIAID